MISVDSGTSLVSILHDNGLIESLSEGRRLIKQRAIKLQKYVVEDDGVYKVIRRLWRGKKKFIEFTVNQDEKLKVGEYNVVSNNTQ